MALVGGGGAGNIAGSNPSGAGTGLNYIGVDPSHAYAFSGLIVSATDTVLLDFTTATNSYIVATFTPIYAVDAGDNAEWEIEINGEIVYVLYSTSATISSLTQDITILLPPASRIRVLGSVGNNRVLGAMLTGRVY